ncbi:MmgE/PrpD family protein [Devosia sp.]|uniref:MmgE/PrpD family protein n=1 Tax=Devosia sp. TaxID=1871048 RepID=UPI002EF9A503
MPAETRDLDQLASFLAEFRAPDLPAEVIARTKLIIADCVGAIVGGAAEPEMAALTAKLAASGPGPALVIGTGHAIPAERAALLNGTAGTWLEMDEGNQFCKGHPGMHTFPAAFARAEAEGAGGLDFLAAVALGYEAGARVGIGMRPRPSMHPHGTWGVLCATVAAGRLGRVDAGGMRSLLNMAPTLSLATSRRTMLEGATVRNTFTGFANQTGVLCLAMLEAGLTGEVDGIGHVFGKVAGDGFDPTALSDRLGSRWEVTRNYFKMHSCCRYNHAALDAVNLILAGPGGDLDSAAIARIDVDTYSLAVELDDPAPANTLAAKFSLPFAIATTLIHGDSGVHSFTWDAVRNADIGRLAARVVLREDPAMTARLPDNRPARVRLTLDDGRSFEAATDTNRGDWSDPYTPDEIHDKYMALATRCWSTAGAAAVFEQIMALERLDDVAALGQAMRGAMQAR